MMRVGKVFPSASKDIIHHISGHFRIMHYIKSIII